MGHGRWLAVIVLAVAVGSTSLAGGQAPAVPYAGLSAQRLPFTLTVGADGRTLSLDVSWMTTCGGVVRTIRPAATTIAADGAFAWTGTFVDPLTDGDEDRQRLALSGRRDADGTLAGAWHADRDFYNGEARVIDGTCSSGDVAFAVSRGGSTSQPGPRHDASGQLVVSLDDPPELVAVGAGKTWVLGNDVQAGGGPPAATTLTAVDPQTGAAEAPMAVAGGGELAAGEGAAWLPSGAPGAAGVRLLRVDARTRRVTHSPRLPLAPGATGSLLTGLTTGAGGAWVLSDDRVIHATSDGRRVRAIRVPADRRVRGAGRCNRFVRARLIAIHGDSVYVMTSTGLRCRSHAAPSSFALARKSPFYSLARIDPRTNRVTRAVPLSRQYSALAAGRGGVWGVACLEQPLPPLFDCRRPAVHRIDLRSGRAAVAVALPAPVGQPPLLEALVAELTVGAGAVWVVQAATPPPSALPAYRRPEPPGVLRRIDIGTRRVSDVRTVPHLPADLAGDDRSTWILDGFDRTLVRVQP
jgi:hypothetical protein